MAFIKDNKSFRIAVIGTGPAGLMAATVASRAGYPVSLYDKKSGPGRKLLIAGSSGLNISNNLKQDDFLLAFRGPPAHFQLLFKTFPREEWISFIHHFGIKTFTGSSGRIFVEGMKASPFLRAWMNELLKSNVRLLTRHECTDFEVLPSQPQPIRLHFASGEKETFNAVCFALGGGSYEPQEIPLRWPSLFEKKGLLFQPFRSANAGFEVDWSAPFLKEAEGLPLKNIQLTSPLGTKSGDLIVTRYGLEGTPIYHVGQAGSVFLDLKPELTPEEIQKRLSSPAENLAPLRRIKKFLKLSPAALALLFHCTPGEMHSDLGALIARIKQFPLTLQRPRPITEAISSAGGLDFSELTPSLMLQKYPGVFVAGEMLNWNAPTGGFLIQTCAAQGFLAGQGMRQYLNESLK